jgi:enoyl-CoA hydratase/carnithine racemase
VSPPATAAADIDSTTLERAGLRLEVTDQVTTITLDRPSRKNAQTPATWEGLARIGAGLPASTRVVVVRGAGDTFSSGLDRRLLDPAGTGDEDSILAMLDQSDDDLAETIATYQAGFTWLRRTDFVSVAAVQGYAIGAGFQLALACDLRLVADDAAFAMREPLLGLVPDLSGTKPLVEMVGYSRALEICATGRFVRAAEARELGLATAVVARAELDRTVADLAAALAEAPSGAVAETKALLQSAHQLDLDDQCRVEREAQVRRFRALASQAGE